MKVALYVRVSTQEQLKEGYSIGEQIERLTKYSESMGWKVYKVYNDGGYSGKDMERPALQDLIQDIKKVDKVVVYKLDRLSRNQRDTLMLIEDVFLKNNVDFVSMSENFDTSTPFGRFMIGILSTFAQLEREQIKERMSMGKDARAKEGRWHGGTLPIGYDYVDGQLVPDDEVSLQIREIYQRFSKCEPLRTIEKDLRNKEIMYNGYYWTPKQMKRIMTNKIYCGFIRHGGKWIKGLHQPIIDEDTFNICNEMIEENKQPNHSTKTSTLLGGLIYCKKCGARYGKQKTGKKKYGFHEYYTCYSRHKKVKSMIKDENCKNKSYSIEELDEMVLNEVRKLSLNVDLIHEMARNDDFTQEKLDNITKEISKINKQLDRYLKLYGSGVIEVSKLDEVVQPLEEKKKKLSEEVATLKKSSELSEDDAVSLVTSFSEVIERNNYEEIRAILENLIDRIEIDGDDIEIHWKF